MSELDEDQHAEDVDVPSPADTLSEDDLRFDPLDVGIDAGEGYRGATRFGTTAEEERRGESLDQLLAEEEPDTGPDVDWTDEEQPRDDDRPSEPRAGRLVAGDEGIGPDEDKDLVAFDVGIDGGGASAEEAAIHLTDDPPFTRDG